MEHVIHDLLLALAGGVLIGLSAGLLMLFRGRILGISGIAAHPTANQFDNLLILLGTPLGLGLYLLLADGRPDMQLTHSPLLLAAAGLLVGFGTRLANGCTSGHAVCGLARFSPHSLTATGLFMAAAIITVAIERLV